MFALTETLPDTEATIRTDQDKLYTILINLVKNSIKYTHEGKIELGYICINDEIEFFVKDTGIGIAKDRHDSIFDRFVQADLSMTKPYEGAGLGLAITKAYVEMLGGKIRVESKEGYGSVFYFTIPYITSADNTDKSTKPLIDSKLEDVYKNVTVLIVDDDETAVIYLSKLLKGKCKDMLYAGTGSEAVEICKANNKINLVMMDIKMPDMDGYTATKLIREFNKEVIIIAQTAYALLGDREKSIQAGCNDYLAKPVRSGDFFSVVGKHLANLQL
jgi:CheY-like chemotaxis protein/anti-sigma regulatory factor (Ser/Thr protein kinase)